MWQGLGVSSKVLIDEGLGLCGARGEGEPCERGERCGRGGGNGHATGLVALTVLPPPWRCGCCRGGDGVAAAPAAARVLPWTQQR